MKISKIIVAFALSVVVKGWVQILQPIVLSLGAAFSALNIDVDLLPDAQPTQWRNWLGLEKDKEKEN